MLGFVQVVMLIIRKPVMDHEERWALQFSLALCSLLPPANDFLKH